MTIKKSRSKRYLIFLRWRGKLNWKDITERVIAGFLSGLAAGFMFWLCVSLLGGGLGP